MSTAQDEPDTIGPEGVEKLCKDLGVEPEDVRMSYLFITLTAGNCSFSVKYNFHNFMDGCHSYVNFFELCHFPLMIVWFYPVFVDTQL